MHRRDVRLTPPRALIFDLDGTLLDTHRDIASACNFALQELGRPPLPVAHLRTLVGDGGRALLSRALGLENDHPIVERALAIYLKRYSEHPLKESVYLPGVEDALSRLRSIPFALATNKSKPIALAILEGLGIRGLFASVFGGGDGPLKPDPFSILQIAKDLGIEPRHLWMIGDGPQDVGAARAAGATAIGVLGGFHRERLLEAAPDAVYPSMIEMVAEALSLISP